MSQQALGDNGSALAAIRDVVAGGASSNMRARGIVEPLVVARAAGSRIWDVQDRELIDVNMGYGPHIFGYADQTWAEDVGKQAALGAMTGIPHVLDREAAGLVAELVPSIEQVRFANSGTEALMSAARLVRMATGRQLIVTFEGHYHGWSETLLRKMVIPGAVEPFLEPGPPSGAAGMIPEAMAHTLQLPWNDTAAVAEVFDRYGDDIAAVFCEPVLGNAGGAGIPPAPAHHHLEARFAAGLRRGHHRLPRRGRERAGPLLGHTGPDGRVQGPRRRFPGRRVRRQP
jgi:glutamate-1-semialdehyde 2,1-aminomutase